MNTKEVENIIEFNNNAEKNAELLKHDLESIKLRHYYNNENKEKMLKQLNSIIKFFYKKPTKTTFYKKPTQYLSSINYQISKRGIGFVYGFGNMKLLEDLFGKDNSLEYILTTKSVYKNLIKNLNDEGKDFFEKLKKLIEKNKNLDSGEIKDKSMKIVLDDNVKKIIGNQEEEIEYLYLECDTDEPNIQLSSSATDTWETTIDLFCYSNKSINFSDSFLSKTLTGIYINEITEFVNENGEDTRNKNKTFEKFIEDFNQLGAKYFTTQLI